MPIEYEHVDVEFELAQLNEQLAATEQMHHKAVTERRLLSMVRPGAGESKQSLKPVEDRIRGVDVVIAALEQQHANLSTLIAEAEARRDNKKPFGAKAEAAPANRQARRAAARKRTPAKKPSPPKSGR